MKDANLFILTKFIKFLTVGLSGTFIDFIITYLFKEQLKLPKYEANALGFSAAAINNYFLNKYWTFYNQEPASFFQFQKFFFIALVGLIFNTFIIYLLNHKFKINFYVAKLVAIGTVSLWNFFANYCYTFNH